MNIFYLLMLTVLAWANGISTTYAQVSNYTFNQANETFQYLSGGTVLATATSNNGGATSLQNISVNVPLPFSFSFNNNSESEVYMSSNGFISFGSFNPTNRVNPISIPSPYQGVIAALGATSDFTLDGFYLAGNPALTADMQWGVEGVAPNREIVFQWKNFKISTAPAHVTVFSFQVRLRETSGVVSVVYGDATHVSGDLFISVHPQVGLRGLSNADFNNRSAAPTAPFTESAPGTANNATQTIAINNTGSAAGLPPDGFTYTWTPSTCNRLTDLVLENYTLTSASISWMTPVPVPVNGYEYYISESNVFSTAPGVPIAGSLITINDLQPHTNYYFWVRARCSASDTSNWAGPLAFKTGYCIPGSPSYSNPVPGHITDFSTSGGITNISNTGTGPSVTGNGYTDYYNDINASIQAGRNLGFNVRFTSDRGLGIWVDLNSNLRFEQNEQLFKAVLPMGTTASGNLAIPSNTAVGEYRMRVLGTYYSSVPVDPCEINLGVDVEDYKLIVYNETMDWANIQSGTSATLHGNPVNIYTQGYKAGLTETPGQAGAGIEVWIGTVVANSNPSTWAEAAWTPALFNAAQNPVNDNDEYVASIGTHLPTGTYYYASRWSLNGSPYRYGGFSSTGGGFWDGITNVNGVLTVNTNTTSGPGINCNDPFIISTYPYQTYATTCGAINNYGNQCNTAYGNIGEDFVYQLNIAAPGTYNISVNATGGSERIGWFLKNDCANATSCIDYALSNNIAFPASKEIYLFTGSYKLIIDSYSQPCSPFAISITPVACPETIFSFTATTTSTTATINYTAPFGSNYILEYGPSATFGTPGTGATAGNSNNQVAVINNSGTLQLTNLLANAYHSFVVRRNCSSFGSGYSVNSQDYIFQTKTANDEASGALLLTTGGPCIEASPHNASASINEPSISCKAGTNKPVWLKFVAPASGAIQLKKNNSQIKVGLFSATDVNDYSTFNIISCVSIQNTLYAVGLTPGETYYISADYISATQMGLYTCLYLKELASDMLSSNAVCTDLNPFVEYDSTYRGWVSLVDDPEQDLIAMVRLPNGTPSNNSGLFRAYQNINTGSVRRSPITNNYYLDRNYFLTFTKPINNIDIRFFFSNAEMAKLTAADGTTLQDLWINGQTEGALVNNCINNFNTSFGIISPYLQTSNGSVSNINWVQTNTNRLSNFFLNKLGQALPVKILYFRGSRQAGRNLLQWKFACSNTSTINVTLERSSDGTQYEAIYSAIETEDRCREPFSKYDLQPLSGLNYYRLKIVDADNKISYSNVVALIEQGGGFKMISITAPPAARQAMLTVASAEATDLEVIIRDVAGRAISKKMIRLGTGISQVPLEVGFIASGIYTITGLNTKGESLTLKFIK